MFDVGFSEMLLCAVIALLVLGPERLPGAVRAASLWIGRFRRSFNDIKSEFEREIGADDIRRQLHNEQVMKKLESGKQQLQKLQNELRAIEQSAQRETRSITQTTANQSSTAPLSPETSDATAATISAISTESPKPHTTPIAPPPSDDKPA